MTVRYRGTRVRLALGRDTIDVQCEGPLAISLAGAEQHVDGHATFERRAERWQVAR